MPSLAELQGLFLDAIASRPGELRAGAELLEVVAPSATQDRAARMEVYAEAYWLRLRDAMREDFPRTAAALGPDGFDELVRDYLAAFPSTHPSLRHLGDRFPGFVAGRDDVAPWLADLARLERTRTDAFDAPDDRVLTMEDLRAVGPARWPQLRLRTIRALRLLPVQWAVHELWGEDAGPPLPGRLVLRVWRDEELRVLHAPLAPRAAAALALLEGGATFATLCGAFADLPDEEAGREAAALLARWTLDGILVSCPED